MATSFQVGKTYNVTAGTLEIRYINDIYFAGYFNGQYDGHWQTGHISNAGMNGEDLNLSLYNSPELLKQTEEQVKATVDKWAVERASCIKAAEESKEMERKILNRNLKRGNMQTEAQKLQSALIGEIRSAALGSENIEALLKDKKAQISQLATLNTLLLSNIFMQANY
jgi:hypothetical protein